MNKLEDRLRTELTAEAEAWQDPSLVAATTLRRTKHGFRAALIGAAAVIVLIGGVALLMRPAGDGQPPGAGNNGAPPTTMTISDAEPAPEWGALVDEGLALIGWTPGVSGAYAISGASRDKKTVTAVVRSADTEQLLLTVSYESFEDLEEAESWPGEMALENGEATLFGALYSTTESGLPALFLVDPVGVIGVHVEDATAAAAMSPGSLRTFIEYLGSSVDTVGLADSTFDGPFEAIPFSGETWQFSVSESANPSRATYKVCYSFFAPGEMTETSGLGRSGCGDWPGDTDQYFVSLGPAIEIDGGVAFLVDLTSTPVAKVRIVGSGDRLIEVAPFRLPESGKQFAVVELPHQWAPVIVEVLDEAGTVLDTSVPLDWSAEDPSVVPEGAGDGRPPSDEAVSDDKTTSTAPMLAPLEAGILQYDMDPAPYVALTGSALFLGGGSSQGTPWAIIGRVIDDGDKPRLACTGVRPLRNEDVCSPIDRSIWPVVYPVGDAGIVVFRPTQDAVAIIVTFDDDGAVEIPVVGVADGYPAIAVISVDRVGQAGSATSINADREMIDTVRWEVTGFFEPKG